MREQPISDVKETMKNYAPQRRLLVLASGAVSDSDSLIFSLLSIISLQVGGQVCKALPSLSSPAALCDDRGLCGPSHVS